MFDLMPFRKSENNVFSYLDDLENNFFGDLSTGVSQFRTDVVDQGDHFQLKADLPGFRKEEIRIDINGETMTVRAEHNEEKEEKNERFVRRERRYGSFARRFDLSGIQQDGITAEYRDGVLELNLPKAEAKHPASRRIEIR